MSRVQSFIQQPHRDANKRRQVQQERSVHSVEKNLSSSFKHKNQRQESEQQAGHRASLWRPTVGIAWRCHERQIESGGRTRCQSLKTNYFGTHLRQISLFPRFLLAALYQSSTWKGFLQKMGHVYGYCLWHLLVLLAMMLCFPTEKKLSPNPVHTSVVVWSHSLVLCMDRWLESTQSHQYITLANGLTPAWAQDLIRIDLKWWGYH